MQPIPYHDDSAAPTPGRIRKLLLLLALIAVVLFIVLRCSGLHFPMWNPGATLDKRLSRDVSLNLPATAKVTHGVREAYRDPAEYYVIEMPAADAAAFIAKLLRQGSALPNPDPRQATIRIPHWWTPQTLPNMKGMEIRRGQAVYRWFYADSVGTIYMVWLDT